MPRSSTASSDGIAVAAVGKSFGAVLALPPTDLVAPAGEVTILRAKNGAGKTTLLRILATLVSPDQGSATVGGFDVREQARQVRGIIGLALVNERSLYWRLNGRQNLELFGRIRGLSRPDRRAAAQQVLDELGLGELGERSVHALSAGQRQRLVLARALVGGPPVLLIDEPLRGLDEEATTLVIEALQRRAASGATVLVATPSLVEYGTLSGRPVVEIQRADASAGTASG